MLLCIQVWASSSTSANSYSLTNHGYSSRSSRPLPHPHSQQPYSPLEPDSSTNAAAPSGGSSSSQAMLRQQRTSSSGGGALSMAVVQINSSSSGSSSAAAVRDRLFEPLDAGANRDYRDQGRQAVGQPVSVVCALRCWRSCRRFCCTSSAGSTW
jgi:hypothetical protein